ncbi:hypothetical protein [Corallococcus sp. AB011P]|uniref:hypothetical protein n=1 Tax=Corallococcus sp. AB011P TaxID=2316735 RepID=UPI001F394909|nr:hypothetical protein [Corallococcus sp. AB011P]
MHEQSGHRMASRGPTRLRRPWPLLCLGLLLSCGVLVEEAPEHRASRPDNGPLM